MSKVTLITKKTEVITLKTGPRGPQGIKGDKGDQGDVNLTQLNTKVDKEVGKGLSSNDFTDVLKSKLDGIEEGAEVNVVTSVSTRVGDVVLNKNDVGLSNVDNTSDVNKPISTATQSALNGKANTVHTHVKADITDFAHTHPISEVTNLQTSLNGKVDKLFATNLVTNGDFSNGTTGWSASGMPLLVENNSLVLHLNNVSGSIVYPSVSQTIQGVSGNIYYVAFDVMNNVSGASASTFFQFGSQTALVYTGNGRKSGVFTANNNTTLAYFNNSIPNNGLLSLNIDNVLLLNLTAIFGAGREPTKWQMDWLLSGYPNSWFNGTSEIGSIGVLMRASSGVQVVTPTLLNSRTGTAQYVVSNDGLVIFRGTASGGSLNTNIFVLPDNIRPTATRTFPISANGAFGVITVAANGEVRQVVGALTNVFLDGIVFKVGV